MAVGPLPEITSSKQQQQSLVQAVVAEKGNQRVASGRQHSPMTLAFVAYDDPHSTPLWCTAGDTMARPSDHWGEEPRS